MIPYWLMFAVPALIALWPSKATATMRRLGWIVIGLLFTLLIGFRVEVGGDWFAYRDYYEAAAVVSFSEAMAMNDPGYMALNWIAGLVDGGIYLVNLLCGAVIMVGVIAFARRQPMPWLAFLVAVPYMIIVVAMGYSRQGVALGFELLALVALMDGRTWRFVVWMICAALFHKTAVVLLPLALLALLALNRNRVWTLVWLSLTGAVLGAALLAEHYEAMWQNYVEAQMVSDGGPIRVAMNALPALLLLVFRKRLLANESVPGLWVGMALLSIVCIPLVGLASTAVDRVALYFMPLQLYVFSRLHRLFDSRLFKTVAVLGVVLGYGLVQWVWLNFASHAPSWLPYRFYPLMGPWS